MGDSAPLPDHGNQMTHHTEPAFTEKGLLYPWFKMLDHRCAQKVNRLRFGDTLVETLATEAIHSLRSAGLPFREIARRLGIHRETVSRHLQIEGRIQARPAAADASRDRLRTADACQSAIGRPILTEPSLRCSG